MPCYEFCCKSCESISEIMRPMSESGEPAFCEECGMEMVRLISLFNPGNKEYGKPIVSDSLAVSMAQIEEHKRTFPDVRITDEGQPVFDSYKQHDDYLRKTGFIKLPGKKKRGTKVTSKGSTVKQS